MLQIIDFDRDSSKGEELHLERIQAVDRILAEIHAKFSFRKSEYSQSEYIIEPWYNQFVVFNWKDYSKEATT